MTICKEHAKKMNATKEVRETFIWQCGICLDEHCRCQAECHHDDPHPDREVLSELALAIGTHASNFLVMGIIDAKRYREAKSLDEMAAMATLDRLMGFIVFSDTLVKDYAKAVFDSLPDEFREAILATSRQVKKEVPGVGKVVPLPSEIPTELLVRSSEKNLAVWREIRKAAVKIFGENVLPHSEDIDAGSENGCERPESMA